MAAGSPVLIDTGGTVFSGVNADPYSVNAGGLSASPSSSSSGGSGSWGSWLQGISNIGLQWFGAGTKGVSGPVIVPQPVQATPGAVVANLGNQLTSYLPYILLIFGGIVALKFLKRK